MAGQLLLSDKEFLMIFIDKEGFMQNGQSRHHPFFYFEELDLIERVLAFTRKTYAEEGILTDDHILAENKKAVEQNIKDWGLTPSIPKTEEPTFIYLMVDKALGYHKIGRSNNPLQREKTLQAEKPTIELVAQYSATKSDEALLHEKFAHKRLRGEWFDLSPEDLQIIENIFNK